MNALQKRLAEQKNPCAVIIEESPEMVALDPHAVLEDARDNYRSIREATDLYGEAISARTYVSLLERRIAVLEAQLRTQSKPHTW